MNKNIELVEKSLDTINPEWEVFLVASMGKNGFEFDTFSRGFSPDLEYQMSCFLALVNASTMKDLDDFFPE
tara:strand:+ start:922 stop:1134 length:213 start_codon:yes stop_codon:yes gene_type:complete